MKQISLLIAILFGAKVLFAQTLPNPMFFQIEKDGNTAYMLGTIHLGIGYSRLPDFVKDEVNAAGTLVVESDMDKAQSVLLQTYPMPSPDSLKAQLSSQQWTKLVSKAKAFGVSEQMLDGFYPFMAMMLMQSGGNSGMPNVSDPMDMEVVKIGKKMNKTIDFLEPVQDALRVLEITMDIDALKAALDAPDNLPDMDPTLMLDTYVAGDEDALYRLTTQGQGGVTPDNLVEILDNRNIRWIPEINRIIQNQGTEVFAFGAGHLAGQVGILELLRQEGYTVNRVTN